MRSINLLVFCIFLALPLLAGACDDDGPLTENWTHNKRHYKKWRKEIDEMHKDFDEIIFDLETDPAEETEPQGSTTYLYVIAIAAALAAMATILLLYHRKKGKRAADDAEP